MDMNTPAGCTSSFFSFSVHIFFLSQVKYLDSLELEGIEINQEGTRVSVWTNAMVTKAIIQDTNNNGTFGKAPVSAKSFLFYLNCAAKSMFLKTPIVSFFLFLNPHFLSPFV